MLHAVFANLKYGNLGNMSAFTVTLIIRNVIGKLNLQGEETPPEPNLFGWGLTKAKNALKRPIYWNYLSFLSLL
ncbi:hypothetical protein EG14_09300 [Porphyromonas gingivalis]|nr:hypothetical protein EG14_09300 [Porphyromonas gingivalis]